MLALAACQAGVVTDSSGDDAPPTGPTTPGGGGTIQRATVSARVSVDPADAAIANAAGITVSGLTVRLVRVASNEAPRSAVTAADGTVRFEGLLQGSYQISVDRPLTPAEIARLAPEDRDATIFAAGGAIYVAPPGLSQDLALVAARRGSLIVSEMFEYNVPVPGAGNDGHYLEVYNNADTTVYLGGVLFFRVGLNSLSSCDELAPYRLDPTGLWAFMIHRFPGVSGTHPVPPGEARVMAIDAIDHRPIGPGMQDLSGAHFEIIGNSADPNNPFAEDMIRMKGFVAGTGHGEVFVANQLFGLAFPFVQDTSALERHSYITTNPQTGAQNHQSIFKIPRAQVIDVAGFHLSREWEIQFRAGESTTCPQFASPVFEREPARLIPNDDGLAVSRRSLGRTASGAEILQRTRTGARDFELAFPLRRSLQRPR
jgi:hypothetical protein